MTFLHYDGWSLIQEGPSASAVDRVYMLGNRIDEIVADYSVTIGQWLYHESDARGHCILLTNGSGNLVEQYEYNAFGEPYFFDAAGTESTSSASGNGFLFTGREYLSELKLYDYRNRMYQPELGRFMQPDPKEFGAGEWSELGSRDMDCIGRMVMRPREREQTSHYNLYRYCHNDPVNKSDPFGWVDIDISPQLDALGIKASDNSLAAIPK
jgi:RHS repeat-associated protein